MDRYLLETSKTVSLLKILWRRYYYLDRYLDNFYKDSQTSHLIDGAFDKIKKNFKYSFVDRVSEIREEKNREPLNNSRIVEYWVNWLRIKKSSLSFYSSLSKIVALIKEIAKEIYRSPLKAGSIIIISAIMVNIALSFLFKREISLFGWVMRGIFLFVGINGFLCNTDWLILRNNSAILRLTRKGAK